MLHVILIFRVCFHTFVFVFTLNCLTLLMDEDIMPHAEIIRTQDLEIQDLRNVLEVLCNTVDTIVLFCFIKFKNKGNKILVRHFYITVFFSPKMLLPSF